MSLIGLLSDTHGQVPAQVVALFSGVDHIVHAGDIGSQDVLLRLQQIAPVTAVRGNCDLDDWAKSLPLRTELNIAGLSLVVAHMPGRLQVPLTTLAGTLSKSAVPAGWEGVLGPSPSREGSRQAPLVGVVGHSHVPAMSAVEGLLVVNPGATGPERFGRPRTVALLRVEPVVCGGGGRSASRTRLFQVRVEFRAVS